MEFKHCYGCMAELETAGAICPHCGYDNTNDPAAQPSHLLPCGTVLNGQHVVGRSLGQGGFGITYIGWNLKLNIPVCIKEYFPDGAALRSATQSQLVLWSESHSAQSMKENRTSFVKEAQKAVQMRDLAHVVFVWDWFYENETAYIVMDYIKGETLKNRLMRTRQPMSERACVNLLAPVMEDLDTVHARGIIHRDIKPDNIMLREDGKPILLDMGAAKDLHKSLPNGDPSTNLVVSHGFSPVEQYREHGAIGPWTDVYAMSATIYYCVTCRVLPPAIERMYEDTADFRTLSPAVAAVLKKGLAIKHEDRYKSMSELLRALREAVAGETPKPGPRPISDPEPLPKTSLEPKLAPNPAPKPAPKSKLWLAALGAAAVLLAVIVLIFVKPGGAKEREADAPRQTTAPVSASPKPTASMPASKQTTAPVSASPKPTATAPTPTPAATEAKLPAVDLEKLSYEVSGDHVRITGCDENVSSIAIPAEITGKPVTSIGDMTFYGCQKLTSITIPDSVTSIGNYAFYYCTSLTSITIPESVTSIGNYAFDGCRSLTSITIPSSVEEIGTNPAPGLEKLKAFSVSAENPYFKAVDGVLFTADGKKLVAFPAGKEATNYAVPEGVTSIGEAAFHHCIFLKNITLPDSVTSIGNIAFWFCDSLESITIPKNVMEINLNPAPGCTSMSAFSVSAENPYFKAIDGVLFTADGKKIVGFPAGKKAEKYAVPDGVIYIGNAAFQKCTMLTEIILPDGVSDIEGYAFTDCDALKSITIPDSVTGIWDVAFSNCSALKDVVYSGTEEQWKTIQIRPNNEPLTDATIHYNG